MAKDPIKKATNGTYYFRANLGYNPVTGKQIQKYRSGFKTKKEAKTRRAGFCLFFYVLQQCKALRHLLREPVTKRRTAKIRNDSLLERPGTSIRSSFRNMTIKNRN